MSKLLLVADDEVIISKDKLEELEDDSKLLQAFFDAGVDNWDGYDYAIELFELRIT